METFKAGPLQIEASLFFFTNLFDQNILWWRSQYAGEFLKYEVVHKWTLFVSLWVGCWFSFWMIFFRLHTNYIITIHLPCRFLDEKPHSTWNQLWTLQRLQILDLTWCLLGLYRGLIPDITPDIQPADLSLNNLCDCQKVHQPWKSFVLRLRSLFVKTDWICHVWYSF